MDGFEGRLAETHRIGNLPPAQRSAEMAGDIEERVNCAAWNWTADACHAREPLAYQVAAGFEFAAHLLDAILIAFQCRQGCVLANARRTPGLLALDIAHGLDDRGGPNGPAHAPAGHGVTLAHAANGKSALGQSRPQCGEAGRPRIAINEPLVDFVAQDGSVGFENN